MNDIRRDDNLKQIKDQTGLITDPDIKNLISSLEQEQGLTIQIIRSLSGSRKDPKGTIFKACAINSSGRPIKDFVVKIGSRESLEGEFDNYTKYIKQGPLSADYKVDLHEPKYNNDKAVLRIDFVDLEKYKVLADYYKDKPIKVLDTLLNMALKPLHENVKFEHPKNINKYIISRLKKNKDNIIKECNRLIPNFENTCKWMVRELDRNLTNPIFLYQKEMFALKKDEEFWTLKSIIHGDLNFNNIFVEDENHIKLIDYEFTKEDIVFDDLARLECEIKFIFLKRYDEQNLWQDIWPNLLEFEQFLIQDLSIDETKLPENVKEFEEIKKAMKCIAIIRKRAKEIISQNSRIKEVAYWIELLIRTLKYIGYNLTDYQKKYALISILLITHNYLKECKTQENIANFPLCENTSVKISIEVPHTNPLIGRFTYLKILDDIWKNSKKKIVCIIAIVGEGKTTLVKNWIDGIILDDDTGVQCIYGRSLNNQSADIFIESALDWFGDKEPTKGSPWEKGHRLAGLIKSKKTLLFIDGLERFQNLPEEGKDSIKDPGLRSLITELAANDNPGLCVITTQLRIEDFKDNIFVRDIDLKSLTRTEGIRLLKSFNLKGEKDEFNTLIKEVDRNALALTLFGSYISIRYSGNIRRLNKNSWIGERKYRNQAIKAIKLYEEWFKDKPELNILHVLAIFDCPIEYSEIKILMEPPIKCITSEIIDRSEEDLRYALNTLKEAKILFINDKDIIESHMLIRKYFQKELKTYFPVEWKEANLRLYEYYKNKTKQLPENLEDMSGLYYAIFHGCESGNYSDVLRDVYVKRIKRDDENFNTKKLGAFTDDLDILSNFFKDPWSLLINDFKKCDRAYILNQVGIDLHAIGRIKESERPLNDALQIYSEIQNDNNKELKISKSLAILHINLNRLYVIKGDLKTAINHAEQAKLQADISGDVPTRIASRAILANTIHQNDKLPDMAEIIYQEAENIQKLVFGYLYLYCDLLLEQKNFTEVQSRSKESLEFAENRQLLLEIGLNHISLGRSFLFQEIDVGSKNFQTAAEHLNKAVDNIKISGNREYLVCALLSRAELNRLSDNISLARSDLGQAINIVNRDGLILYKADCYIECAKQSEEKDKKVGYIDKAKKIINDTGYHRRDKEIKEIEKTVCLDIYRME